MRARRSLLALTLLAAALGLAACGGDDAAAPAPEPAPAPPPLPKDPEAWAQERIFVEVGARNIVMQRGTQERASTLLLNAQLADDTEESRAAFLLQAEKVLAGLRSEGVAAEMVCQIRAEPGTPWVRVGDLIAIASGPIAGMTRFDLRMPWDEGPHPVVLAQAGVEGHPLDIAFRFAPPEEEGPEMWTVKAGASSTFQFHAAYDPALRQRDVPAMQGLRSALQGFSRTWREKRRRVELSLPREPSPSYINVLTVLRICAEKRFSEFTLRDAAE